MPTLIFPISRIEGHAQVVIDTHGDEVVSAHFQATEFRGFDYFVQGIPAEQMPVIVPRICGVCSTAHHVCSVKALESLYRGHPPASCQAHSRAAPAGAIDPKPGDLAFYFHHAG